MEAKFNPGADAARTKPGSGVGVAAGENVVDLGGRGRWLPLSWRMESIDFCWPSNPGKNEMVENVMGRSAEVVFYGFSSPKRPINNIVFLKTWKNIVSFSDSATLRRV